MKIILLGLLTPVIVYATIFVLHLVLPARKVSGYVTDPRTGKKFRYRLNGLPILFLSVALWILLGHFQIIPLSWLFSVRYWSLAGAFVIGFVFSLLVVLPFPSTGKPLLADFFFGRLENPQMKGSRADAKMVLYLVGAVMLELNVLSFAAFHLQSAGQRFNPGVILYTALVSWFVIDYLTFEQVHLYTYDFFAERVGFKLGWGCLTFYPFFYSVGLFMTAQRPDPRFPLALTILSAVLFLGGWICARGANMQKFFFKTRPEKAFLGQKPQTITDGNRTLLVGGFWGASRHINYMGEILMASGIAMSLGYPGTLWPWLYPLYYVALLVPRQIADDRRCSLKYGALWAEYEKRVRYRIIPFIY